MKLNVTLNEQKTVQGRQLLSRICLAFSSLEDSSVHWDVVKVELHWQETLRARRGMLTLAVRRRQRTELNN